MKLHLECIPCYIRQALEAAQMVTDDIRILGKVLRESLIAASKFDMGGNGLLTQAMIQKSIKNIIPAVNPYIKVKKEFNIICLKLVDEFKKMIKDFGDPFEGSLRMALAGNIIDFGPQADLNREIIIDTIKGSLSQDIDTEKIIQLKENIHNAKKILYIGDNAGEIVLDRLFIENLPTEKIKYAVRGGPALNDATMEDAVMTGMTDIVNVINTGLDMPAAVLDLCSKEFIKEYDHSDLIISKGQGNYEALSDERKNIFFLLKIKCPVIAESFNYKYKVGDIVVDC